METSPHLYRFIRKRRIGAASEQDVALTKPFDFINPDKQNSTAILLVHGFMSSPSCMLNIAINLKDHVHRILCPLLPGHATTAQAMADVSWHDWYNEIKQAYLDLRVDHQKVIVVGISLGGALSLVLANEFSNIDELVLLVPGVYPPLALYCAPLLTPLVKCFGVHYFKNLAGDIKKADAYEVSPKNIHVNAFVELNCAITAARNCLPTVTTNTTIIASEQDHVLPKGGMLKTFNNIGSPQKEIIWLNDCYHVITLDNQVDVLITKIKEKI